ncbi:MAG: single-stranded DNA-binding protein [Chloroflexi bacterium]|nr:single-stranded DNA-binding protein [Chloroflexota bacterium]
MNNLNSILIEGNLTRDPELSYTAKGTAVCKFSVAVNRFSKQDGEEQKDVSFFDVTTWARLAEVCAEYLKKGRGVRVVGRLKQDRWIDPDGKTHSCVIIVAEHVEFKPQLKKQVEEGQPEPSGGQAETAAPVTEAGEF